MVWNAKGDERIKSYRLYQELEAAYASLKEENEQLVQQLKEKNGLIRRMAGQHVQELKEKNDLIRRMAAQLAIAPFSDMPGEEPPEANVGQEKTISRPTTDGQKPAQPEPKDDLLGHIVTKPLAKAGRKR